MKMKNIENPLYLNISIKLKKRSNWGIEIKNLIVLNTKLSHCIIINKCNKIYKN